MKDNGCYFLDGEETEKVSNYVVNREKILLILTLLERRLTGLLKRRE